MAREGPESSGWAPGVPALPSGQETRVKRLLAAGKYLEQAAAGSAVVIELDISRGDMLADPAAPPRALQEVEADLCWLSETPWQPARKYWLKQTTRTVGCVVRELVHQLDVNSLGRVPKPGTMAMNDIVRVGFKL